jgi:hypothetical protein
MKTKRAFAALVVLPLAACGAGLGSAVRTDISERMATAKDPLATCYEARLKANRRLRGTVVVAVTAEAKTGKFTDVTIRRDDLGDPGLNDCLVTEVGKLALTKPTSTKVQFEYPFEFLPTDLAR